MIDTKTAPYAALLLRVSLGVLFLAHGLLLKVMTFGIPGTVGYFQSLGFPAVFAYLVLIGEIGGGVALIFGFYTRYVALLTLPILVGATMQHIGNGWLFNVKDGGWEFPVLWTLLLIVQAALGDGAFAISRFAFGSAPRTAEAH